MAKKAKLAVVMRGVSLAVFCAFFGLSGAVGGIWLMADDLRGQEGPPGQPGMSGPAGEAGVEGPPGPASAPNNREGLMTPNHSGGSLTAARPLATSSDSSAVAVPGCPSGGTVASSGICRASSARTR